MSSRESSTAALVVEAARKTYGEVVALGGVSLEADGEILGVVDHLQARPAAEALLVVS